VAQVKAALVGRGFAPVSHSAWNFETMPEAHVVIVIDGEDWREGALAWLRNAAQNPPPPASGSTCSTWRTF